METVRLHRFSVEEEWSGLETISDILVVTILVTLSSESDQKQELSHLQYILKFSSRYCVLHPSYEQFVPGLKTPRIRKTKSGGAIGKLYFHN